MDYIYIYKTMKWVILRIADLNIDYFVYLFCVFVYNIHVVFWCFNNILKVINQTQIIRI